MLLRVRRPACAMTFCDKLPQAWRVSFGYAQRFQCLLAWSIAQQSIFVGIFRSPGYVLGGLVVVRGSWLGGTIDYSILPDQNLPLKKWHCIQKQSFWQNIKKKSISKWLVPFKGVFVSSSKLSTDYLVWHSSTNQGLNYIFYFHNREANSESTSPTWPESSPMTMTVLLMKRYQTLVSLEDISNTGIRFDVEAWTHRTG